MLVASQCHTERFMNINIVLFGILPLVAFVVIDSFMGLKAGLISAVVLALTETMYSLYEFGELDGLSIASLALVAAFAFLSLKFNNPLYMKLQPVFLGVCFGAVLLVMQGFGKPVLLVMLEKYDTIIPAELREGLRNPIAKHMLARLSLILGFGFLVHAVAILYAAMRMSSWWWLIIRGVGLYVMMFICVVITRFF